MSTASRTINWSRYRSEFPVTKRYIYFNHAAVSPLSTRVLKAINEISEGFLTICTVFRGSGPRSSAFSRSVWRLSNRSS